MNKEIKICGEKSANSDHKCNTDGLWYYTKTDDLFFKTFKTGEDALEWYCDNYKDVIASSTACSICKKSAFNDSMWM